MVIFHIHFMICVTLRADMVHVGSMMNGLQALPSWKRDFGDPKGYTLGAVNAAQSAGSILVLPVCGMLADKIGRRWTLLFGGITILVASAVQAASVNLGMFIFSRVLVGAGAITIIQPSPLLITELAYPPHRGVYTALFWTNYYLGAIIAAWSTYGLQKNSLESHWAWRGPSILQGGLPLLQLAFVSHLLPKACISLQLCLFSGGIFPNLPDGSSPTGVAMKLGSSSRNFTPVEMNNTRLSTLK
jgi:MFS family permease